MTLILISKYLQIEVPEVHKDRLQYKLIDYQGQHLGVLGVLSFKSNNQDRVEIYADKVKLLKGFVATEQKVEKGEVVAEVLPGAIDFLNNYSFVKADLRP